MTHFWRGLESMYGSDALAVTWREHLGDDFERIKTSLLTNTGKQATYYPSAQVCECSLRVVQHAPDHIMGISDCETSCCKDVRLNAADLVLFALNEKKLARAIANALGCDLREAETPIVGTRQVATFGASSVPVLLTVAQSQQGFASRARELVGHFGKHFIVLTPTSRFVDANSQTILRNASAGLVALDSVLTLLPNGTMHSAKTAGELFSPYLPQAAEMVSDNEALRLFGLVKALELETRFRKAPVTRVFQLYCIDGESRNSVAKKCACAPSLITLRLQALEKKLGRPPEQLRQLSGHFEKIADSLTDSRARNVYRKGAMDESEEE